MTAAGIIPLAGVVLILVLFVGMVFGKRRAQRARGERD